MPSIRSRFVAASTSSKSLKLVTSARPVIWCRTTSGAARLHRGRDGVAVEPVGHDRLGAGRAQGVDLAGRTGHRDDVAAALDQQWQEPGAQGPGRAGEEDLGEVMLN